MGKDEKNVEVFEVPSEMKYTQEKNLPVITKEITVKVKKTREKLEPWEAKLIGRKDRYENTWMYWAKKNFAGTEFGQNLSAFVDNMYDQMKTNIDPKVNRYEIFGKKVNRPWGAQFAPIYSTLSSMVSSQTVREMTKNMADKFLTNTSDMHFYLSGVQIATELFTPSIMQEGYRSVAHFEDKYLAEFMNATGIVPDEGAMIGDLMNEMMRINDSNYKDTQWREYVMPTILKGSFQTQLNRVYDLLLEDYQNNPYMSKEILSDKMNKAEKALGNLYQDFSRNIANNTEYLSAPLQFMDTDGALQHSNKVGSELSMEETEKFNQHKTEFLISKKESDGFKKRILNSIPKVTPEKCVENFYKGFTGVVGPQESRPQTYNPEKASEDPSTPEQIFNMKCFIQSAKALKDLISLYQKANPKGYKKQECLDASETMTNAFRDAFHVSDEELKYIIDPKNSISDVMSKYGVTNDLMMDYTPVEVPPIKNIAENNSGSYYNAVSNLWKSTSETVTNVVNSVYETAKTAYNNAKDLFTGEFIKGDFKVDFQDDDIDLFDKDDRLDGVYEEMHEKEREEQRAKEKEKAEAHLKELENKVEEARKQAQQEEEQKRQQEIDKKLASEQKAQEEQNKVNETLDKLPPWQKKIIGQNQRYKDSWTTTFVNAIQKTTGLDVDSAIDNLMGYMKNTLDPEVHQFEVYGKKLKKAWDSNLGCGMLGSALDSNMVKNPLKNTLKRLTLAPSTDIYTSGETVAVTCFAPSFLKGELRPPCHFNKAYLAELYNATGVQLNEGSVIGTMMNEAMNIADSNYTDQQWRTMLMPKIISGSFEAQLQQVYKHLADEYKNNPAMDQDMYQSRMEKSAELLGKIYTDFSERIADTTEYLEGPMNLLKGKGKEKLPQEALAVMTEDQIKKYENFKPKGLISEEKLQQMKSKAISVSKKKETPTQMLESFLKAISGKITEEDDPKNFKTQNYLDPNRTPENDRAMMVSIIKMRQVNDCIKKHTLFDKLFNKNMMKDEKLILDCMKDNMTVKFGMNRDILDTILDSKMEISEIKTRLNIKEEAILGYQKVEVPDAEEMKKEVADYGDYVLNGISNIPSLAKGALSVAKTVGKTGVQLAGTGVKYVANKAMELGSTLYEKIVGPDPNKLKEDEYWAEETRTVIDMEAMQQREDQLRKEAEELEHQQELEREKERIENEKSLAAQREEEARDAEMVQSKLSEFVGDIEVAQRGYFGGFFGYFTDCKTFDHIDNNVKSVHESATKELLDFAVNYPDQFITAQEQLPEQVYETLGKMMFTDVVRSKVENNEWTVAQGNEALYSNKIQEGAKKFAESALFREACNNAYIRSENFDDFLNSGDVLGTVKKELGRELKKQKNADKQLDKKPEKAKETGKEVKTEKSKELVH